MLTTCPVAWLVQKCAVVKVRVESNVSDNRVDLSSNLEN
jgi:hypothetical protein